MSTPVPYSQLHEHSKGKEDDSEAIIERFLALDAEAWDCRSERFLEYRDLVLRINEKNQAADQAGFAALQDEFSEGGSFDPSEISRDSDDSELAYSHSRRFKPRGSMEEGGGRKKDSHANEQKRAHCGAHRANHVSKFSSV
ncbi:hypothetical protein EON64_11530 [archaeon]|nr:MAG: hypothetical protein EON64_11530 [archaeon]